MFYVGGHDGLTYSVVAPIKQYCNKTPAMQVLSNSEHFRVECLLHRTIMEPCAAVLCPSFQLAGKSLQAIG